MSPSDFENRVSVIKHNLEAVRSNITAAAQRAGRNADEVQLIAVTKLQPLEVIKAGFQAGIRNFGENYPEEAAEKILAVDVGKDVKWHMIGHIQSRKADIVCRYFDMVHSLDRMKIARYLDRYSGELGKVIPVLLEVNISGEESKYGWQAWDEKRWSELIPPFNEISQMAHIKVQGLMCMPPFFSDPEATRPLYRRLGRLQQFLRDELPGTDWLELSIGTSFDYQVAIEEGATMIRVGTGLFGHRPV
jgi:pyridoxal phosphate enzyme (YggS family)